MEVDILSTGYLIEEEAILIVDGELWLAHGHLLLEGPCLVELLW